MVLWCWCPWGHYSEHCLSLEGYNLSVDRLADVPTEQGLSALNQSSNWRRLHAIQAK